MTLADLHRHLDGSFRAATLAELAVRAGREPPEDLRFFRGMGLSAALSRFGFVLSVMQEADAVRRVAAEICEDAAADGVTTLEIRFAPQLHRAAPLESIVDAALEGIGGRAGLILCGLYGEPPALVERLVEAAASRPGVVGIDLAGGPDPAHEHALSSYAPAFRRARALGIGRTVHAGEGRPPGEIRTAIEELHAQRIGHGTTLLDDPAVCNLVVERGVTIEACATSNVHTGVIGAVTEHPIGRWLDRGVHVAICTDNVYLSDVTASEEHRRVSTAAGMSREKLATAIEHGHRARFVRA